ncbi:MAG: right-handed parallel beta-helix repeat-containing protein [Phycisphaerales bacterium]
MATEKVFEKTCRLYARSFLFISLFVPILNAANIYVYPPGERIISEEGQGTDVYREDMNYILYPNIQAAIDAAIDGDVITLAPFRWKGDGNRDLDFKGKAITLSSMNPDDPNIVAATIIDCNGTETQPHRGFYFHSGEDNNSVVCGITITNGYHSSGGAICCVRSGAYIHHCNIVRNAASVNGIVLLSSYSILSDCTIADNNAMNAVFANGSSLKFTQIKNCIIKNNVWPNYCAAVGGGSYTEIKDCIITNNMGSGIDMRGSQSAIVSNCLIRGNGTTKYKQSTMGIQGVSSVENCSVIENIGSGASSTEIRNSFIGYNSGNGISNCQNLTNSKVICNGGVGVTYQGIIQNCVIAKNKKQGIYYSGNNMTVLNCTVVENNIGIETLLGLGKIVNCIIRDNFNEQIKGAIAITRIQNTNSYINDGFWHIPYAGNGNIDEEPNFVSEKDYHLAAGSPCVDAGTNDANYVIEANDIEGSSRIIDGDGNGDATADMGAYEYNTERPVIAVWADRIIDLTNAGEIKGKIYIKNAGSGILNYEIVSDESWLTINNPIGTSCGEIQEVNVFIDSNNLALGDYRCRIKAYSDEAANNEQEYWLDVHIGSLWTVPSDANTIQDAIDLASNFDYVRVMDGNYTGTRNRNINFNGKNIVLYSDSGNPKNCIINCLNGGDGFRIISGEKETMIEGFSIIRAGYAVTCDACSSPTITNCIFSNSYNGIYIKNHNCLKINNCKFLNLSSIAINCQGYPLDKIFVSNCEFYDQGRSDGIKIYGGNKIIVEDCNFSNLGQPIGCGGIRGLTIKNCMIRNCKGGIDFSSIGHFEINSTFLQKNKWNSRIYGGISIRNAVRGKLDNCKIIDNKTKYGIPAINIDSTYSVNDILIKNCLLAANDMGCNISSANRNNIIFENCTFTDNLRNTLISYASNKVSFKNCILWDANIVNPSQSPQPVPNISYCDVRGGWEGIGNIDVEPEFVRPGYWDANGTAADVNDDFWVEGDYHLKSEGWRWDEYEQEWTFDIETTSRCIDAGSPGYSLGDEPMSLDVDPTNEYGENLRIDMGYYGGTAEASMAPYRWAVLSDMDNSGRVNLKDFSYLGSFFGFTGEKLDGDLNRDERADFKDAAILADEWLEITSWARR